MITHIAQPLALALSIHKAMVQADDDGSFCHHIYSNSVDSDYRQLLLDLMNEKVRIYNALSTAQTALTSIMLNQ